jgi:hypothetical protein
LASLSTVPQYARVPLAAIDRSGADATPTYARFGEGTKVVVISNKLKFKSPLVVLLSCSLIFHPAPLYAWSQGGHTIIALVAWLQLDPQTRTKAVELLKQHERFQADFAALMPPSVSGGTQELKGQWTFLNAAYIPRLLLDAQ